MGLKQSKKINGYTMQSWVENISQDIKFTQHLQNTLLTLNSDIYNWL